MPSTWSTFNFSRSLLLSLVVASVLMLAACDEGEAICYSGTVLGSVSCSGSDGTPILVRINLPGGSERVVGTTSLPPSLQEEGTRLFFKMRASDENIFCTTDITPPKFFELYDVSTDPCGE